MGGHQEVLSQRLAGTSPAINSVNSVVAPKGLAASIISTSGSIIGIIINTNCNINGGSLSAVFVDTGSRCLLYAASHVELK